MQTHSSCWVVAQTVMCNYVCVGQLLGCGSVAQTVLSRNSLGEPLTVHIGFSIGLMMGVYVAGGVSGKHVYCIVRTTFTLYNNHRCVCVCVCVCSVLLDFSEVIKNESLSVCISVVFSVSLS